MSNIYVKTDDPNITMVKISKAEDGKIKDYVFLIDSEDVWRAMKCSWYVCSFKRPYMKSTKYGYFHRYIMSPPVEMSVDHINNDVTDNRKCNLRICTNKQNIWNRPSYKGFKGVTKRKGRRFQAAVKKDGNFYHIGTYDTEIEAAKAYNEKAKELFGEYAHLNVIPEQDREARQ